MFARLNWLSFSERVKYKKALVVFKCINKMTNLYMTNPFTSFIQIQIIIQIRETRQSTDMALRIPFARKESYAIRFAVTGPIIWNNLHVQLRTMACVTYSNPNFVKCSVIFLQTSKHVHPRYFLELILC